MDAPPPPSLSSWCRRSISGVGNFDGTAAASTLWLIQSKSITTAQWFPFVATKLEGDRRRMKWNEFEMIYSLYCSLPTWSNIYVVASFFFIEINVSVVLYAVLYGILRVLKYWNILFTLTVVSLVGVWEYERTQMAYDWYAYALQRTVLYLYSIQYPVVVE